MIFFEKEPYGLLLDTQNSEEQVSGKQKKNRQFKTMNLLNLTNILGFRFYLSKLSIFFIPIGNEYQTVITFQFIGYFGEIIGLKATLYNPEYSDKGGLFYCVFNQFSRVDSQQQIKKLLIPPSQKGYLEKYQIFEIAKQIGFQKMKEGLTTTEDDQPVLKNNRISGCYNSVFDSLDEFFSVLDLNNQDLNKEL